jgi:hypothetical protein
MWRPASWRRRKWRAISASEKRNQYQPEMKKDRIGNQSIFNEMKANQYWRQSAKALWRHAKTGMAAVKRHGVT